MQIWTDWTSCDKLAFRPEFAMTTLESLNTKIVVNLLSFPLITHMVPSDAWFDSYEFSNVDPGSERFWTDWQ
jgi:hypothetical protein